MRAQRPLFRPPASRRSGPVRFRIWQRPFLRSFGAELPHAAASWTWVACSFYLPVAEMSANVFVFLAMGGAVGFLSGMFGVGGGFLMTPLLIFAGIPAVVAVGTETAQILASSVSGALAQWRRRNVDVKMGAVLLAGGLVGSTIGVELVGVLRRLGVFDVFVAACYVTFLGVIGTLMMIESTNTIRQTRAGRVVSGRRSGQHNWVHGLPLKMRFNRSKLYISAIPPLLLGLFVGLLRPSWAWAAASSWSRP